MGPIARIAFTNTILIEVYSIGLTLQALGGTNSIFSAIEAGRVAGFAFICIAISEESLLTSSHTSFVFNVDFCSIGFEAV